MSPQPSHEAISGKHSAQSRGLEVSSASSWRSAVAEKQALQKPAAPVRLAAATKAMSRTAASDHLTSRPPERRELETCPGLDRFAWPAQHLLKLALDSYYHSPYQIQTQAYTTGLLDSQSSEADSLADPLGASSSGGSTPACTLTAGTQMCCV